MKLGETEVELSCVRGNNQQMEIENGSFVLKIDELNGQIECGKQLQITYQSSIEDLQTTIENSQRECALLQFNLQTEKERTSALEKQIESIQNSCCELESQVTLFKKDYEEKSASYKEQIKDLETEKKKMDEKMENYEVLLSDGVLLEKKIKLCEQALEENYLLEMDLVEKI